MKNRLPLLIALVVFLSGAAFATAAISPPSTQTRPAPNAEQTYWLTIKSGIRHNTRCQYFHNSNGRPCTKDEGRACKKCGG